MKSSTIAPSIWDASYSCDNFTDFVIVGQVLNIKPGMLIFFLFLYILIYFVEQKRFVSSLSLNQLLIYRLSRYFSDKKVHFISTSFFVMLVA